MDRTNVKMQDDTPIGLLSDYHSQEKAWTPVSQHFLATSEKVGILNAKRLKVREKVDNLSL
jgi:hypothetical protein